MKLKSHIIVFLLVLHWGICGATEKEMKDQISFFTGFLGLTSPEFKEPVPPECRFRAQFEFAPSFHPKGVFTIKEEEGELTFFLEIQGESKHLYQEKIVDADLHSLSQLIEKYEKDNERSFIQPNALDGIWWTADIFEAPDKRITLLFGNANDTSPEQDFADALIEQVYRSSENPAIIEYIEQIDGYLRRRLHVKIDSAGDSIVVRFFSGLGWGYETKLEQIFQRLPKSQSIIMDMSNFSGMGTLYYPLFRRFLASHENLVWIASGRAKEQLLEIGVQPEKIRANKAGDDNSE